MSAKFAQSYGAAGRIVTLPQSGLRLLERRIKPGLSDLVGLYPYSMCRDWGAVTEEVRALQGVVALSFVGDPFAEDAVWAASADWDLCRPFKTHFVLNLGRNWRDQRGETLRRYLRRAAERLSLEARMPDSRDATRFWQLYQHTLARRTVTGLAVMSEAAFAQQLAVPGGRLVLARKEGAVVGMLLSYTHHSHSTGHLMAFDPDFAGDHVSAALIDAAAGDAEGQGARWFNLGGAAGGAEDPLDGLYQFKRRWTKETRQALLCGAVLDPDMYQELSSETGGRAYFPAYRAPGGAYAWLPEL